MIEINGNLTSRELNRKLVIKLNDFYPYDEFYRKFMDISAIRRLINNGNRHLAYVLCKKEYSSMSLVLQDVLFTFMKIFYLPEKYIGGIDYNDHGREIRVLLNFPNGMFKIEEIKLRFLEEENSSESVNNNVSSMTIVLKDYNSNNEILWLLPQRYVGGIEMFSLISLLTGKINTLMLPQTTTIESRYIITLNDRLKSKIDPTPIIEKPESKWYKKTIEVISKYVESSIEKILFNNSDGGVLSNYDRRKDKITISGTTCAIYKKIKDACVLIPNNEKIDYIVFNEIKIKDIRLSTSNHKIGISKNGIISSNIENIEKNENRLDKIPILEKMLEDEEGTYICINSHEIVYPYKTFKVKIGPDELLNFIDTKKLEKEVEDNEYAITIFDNNIEYIFIRDKKLIKAAITRLASEVMYSV